jgi:hypothetical protein
MNTPLLGWVLGFVLEGYDNLALFQGPGLESNEKGRAEGNHVGIDVLVHRLEFVEVLKAVISMKVRAIDLFMGTVLSFAWNRRPGWPVHQSCFPYLISMARKL